MTAIPDRRNVLAVAILDHILDVHANEQGGMLPVAIDPDIIRQSLVVALASVMEADSAVRTVADMRAARDKAGRELLLQLQAARRHYEQTGYRAWDIKYIKPD
ncbi:hypothetical protein [Sphingomonas montanisoli]|uniref:Uncharacterized protein n=1 Tax=Sphingomonas montanisoli TaxID=2606412 RepID=A0A5D9C4L5_9SPHN|nr:hypothetical protein [Sphingomonas montanisoli]TZG25960.1 hypothetical protein FYJ91_13380 [Sphingomonas montanisoli]